MGPVTADILGVSVQTSSDTHASDPVLSGVINGKVVIVSFSIASNDRIASKTGVPVTASFHSSTLLPIGGSITLSHPSQFFGSAVPTFVAGSSSVAGLSGTCTITATSITIVTAGASIPPSAHAVTLTLSGFTMGIKTAGSDVTLATSADIIVSDAVHSGGIFSQVSAVSFDIATSDRIALKTSVSVTLHFTPTTELPGGSTVTLNYPAAFFASSVTPQAIADGHSNVVGLTGTCGATASTHVIITTAGAPIPAAAAFQVTIRYRLCFPFEVWV
jgi:hypothetical protein